MFFHVFETSGKNRISLNYYCIKYIILATFNLLIINHRDTELTEQEIVFLQSRDTDWRKELCRFAARVFCLSVSPDRQKGLNSLCPLCLCGDISHLRNNRAHFTGRTPTLTHDVLIVIIMSWIVEKCALSAS
ncbi:MAG: hypothetical protein DRG83_18385 [Deltaproteobacteria bacterium]|nr:MAG: hypothetical protein DRG83_18385 [Deltaproteobacteria bacterium]